MEVVAVTDERGVLVVDAGSSSLHLVVLAEDDGELARRDLTEPVGDRATEIIEDFLREAPEITAVGHRLVHEGAGLRGPVRIDDGIRAQFGHSAALAPLHMPPALAALDAARALLPHLPHIACVDTTFHADLPDAARTYALPRDLRERFGLRRYGFHGLSYAWALERAAALLECPADAAHLVITHLGGGCSACAVRDGRSVDTTMGFTPWREW